MSVDTPVPPASTGTEPRVVSYVVGSIRTTEGAGFPVRRPLPVEDLPYLDPFLMIDQVGPIDLAPGEAKGAPPHPHRGFSTVAYVMDGDIEYADSQGHRGVVPPGGVQWLTAGSGIVHSAMPTDRFLARGGRQHNLQIWVNLPARLKGEPSETHTRTDAEIPVAATPDGGRVKVLAGTAHGVQGPFATPVPVLIAHVTLPAGAGTSLDIPAGHNAAVYTLTGAGRVAGHELPDGRLAVLSTDGDHVAVAAAPDQAVEFLVLAGEPIGEVIARSGPFVMNTQAEIRTAYDDYNAGRMGALGL